MGELIKAEFRKTNLRNIRDIVSDNVMADAKALVLVSLSDNDGELVVRVDYSCDHIPDVTHALLSALSVAMKGF